MPFSQATLERALDTELADWSSRGYRVVSRTPTSAQIVKPKPPIAILVVVWLLVCLGWLFTFGGLLSAGGAFLIGLLVLLAYQSRRRDVPIYLNVSPDGEIHQR